MPDTTPKIEKAELKYWEESKQKWTNARAALLNKQGAVPLTQWFDEINTSDCGFCKAFKTCEKCPAIYALACCKISDSRVTYWKIWDACVDGVKYKVDALTLEMIDKIDKMREFFV